MRLIRIIRLIRLMCLIRRRNITHSVTRRAARLLPHSPPRRTGNGRNMKGKFSVCKYHP